MRDDFTPNITAAAHYALDGAWPADLPTRDDAGPQEPFVGPPTARSAQGAVLVRCAPGEHRGWQPEGTYVVCRVCGAVQPGPQGEMPDCPF